MIINQKEKLFTVSEAAEVLGVSTQHLFNLIAAPQIEKVYQANRVLLSKETVRELVMRKDV